MVAKLIAHLRQEWIGVLALFLVLSGGTAYALDSSNTVFSDDIVNGEVGSNDLAANGVGSGKIADQQVKNADLGPGASSSNTIADSGIQGIDVKDDALTGDDIDESSLDISSLYVNQEVVTIAASEEGIADVHCDIDSTTGLFEEATGGGGEWLGAGTSGPLLESAPLRRADGVPSGWRVVVRNDVAAERDVLVMAICAG